MRLNATRLGSIASSRSFGDQLDDLAGQVPGLDLNFAQNKSLIDDYSGTTLVTFTRASTGTFVDSDGLIKSAATNEPRFDHNPTTGESLGLLVEEARTNLLLQSNGFNTTWTNTNSSETSLSGTAPDGTNTAWELKDTSDASAVVHALNQTISFISGTAYTVSCWMKAGALTEGGFTFPLAAFTSSISARVSLSTGAVISTSAGVTATTQQFPNGWWRVSATATATATASSFIQVRIMNGGVAYIGTGTGTILIWGAQLEAGAFSTSYIPTTTATVTRAADVASITGSNFSSWYNQTEGTVFVDAFGVNNINVSTRAYVEIRDVSSSERILLGYGTTSNNRFLVGVAGGVTAADISVASLPKAKATGAYKVNSFQLASNNILGTEDVVGLVPTVTQLQIGSQDGSTANTFINGTIKRLTYWPVRLADTTLQQITQP
jgi:hypothetical protein